MLRQILGHARHATPGEVARKALDRQYVDPAALAQPEV
jgi:hypothetical protein